MDREKHLSRVVPERCLLEVEQRHTTRLRRYQGEPVDGRAELENDRVSLRNDDLAVLVDRAASFLRTRPPVAQQHEQILHVNAAAKVEVGETIFLGRARSPDAQQDEQILHANVVVAVEVE